MNKPFKGAFTLTEVLLTLLIVGFIAAITIPSLLSLLQNRQAETATKKAAFTISNAIKMLIPKEIDCRFNKENPSIDMATCMSFVMSGSQLDNELTTADDIVYKFYVHPISEDDLTFEEVCGTEFTTWNGGGSCAVVIDTNGLKKGTVIGYPEIDDFSGTGFVDNPEQEPDVVALAFNKKGIRPIAYSGASNITYKYLHGIKNFNPGKITYCLQNNGYKVDPEHIYNSEIVQCSSPANTYTIHGLYTTSVGSESCPEGYSADNCSACTGKTKVSACTVEE